MFYVRKYHNNPVQYVSVGGSLEIKIEIHYGTDCHMANNQCPQVTLKRLSLDPSANILVLGVFSVYLINLVNSAIIFLLHTTLFRLLFPYSHTWLQSKRSCCFWLTSVSIPCSTRSFHWMGISSCFCFHWLCS